MSVETKSGAPGPTEDLQGPQKGHLGTLGSAGALQEVKPLYWLPGAQKTAKTACFGPSTGKTKLMAAKTPKILVVLPLGIIWIDE